MTLARSSITSYRVRSLESRNHDGHHFVMGFVPASSLFCRHAALSLVDFIFDSS